MNKEYNRLVLIGNGFDRALGLKTSYSDFILNYLQKIEKRTFSNRQYNDTNDLISFKVLGPKVYQPDFLQEILSLRTVQEFIVFLKGRAEISYKYDFIKEIVTILTNARWVDIEQHYYVSLKRKFRLYKVDKERGNNPSDILALNKCMDELTIALKSYIKEQEVIITMKHIDLLSSLFESIGEPLRPQIASLVKRHDRPSNPSEVLFLNFNYTNTVQQIIDNSFVHGNNKQLFIHGTVKHDDNPIIFGYGDDTGEDYKELEIEGVNELLRKIKSFQYPRTHNYHNLLNYLEVYEFDVFVIGHSCGLSDRTLLKSIFEHPNCLAIQNYHFKGESEDFDKRMEISRHFENKALMRERVLPYDNFASIPQYIEQ